MTKKNQAKPTNLAFSQLLSPQDNAILTEIANAVYQGQSLTGENGVMTRLLKLALEASMRGEINAHMDSDKLENPHNRKNGKTTKTVHSQFGDFQLETPRDRDNSYEPIIVPKRETQLHPEIDNKIIRLYGHGLSYEQIAENVKEIYGLDMSPAAISAITDQLVPEIRAWQARPLDAVYPIIFFDAMFFKVRENGTTITKAMYNILAINTKGYKEILGFYLADSEGASFWRYVLNDLINRGVKDILIACVNGLKGFSEAIHSAFPKCEVQPCIVHAIRKTLALLPHKIKKEFMENLKKVYKANDKQSAIYELQQLNAKWAKYAYALKYWNENCENLFNYFKFSYHIRKLIYTTNAIEGFHRQVRKITKTKGAFTSENALQKLTYCAIQNIAQKWTKPMHNWPEILAELDAIFHDRLTIG